MKRAKPVHPHPRLPGTWWQRDWKSDLARARRRSRRLCVGRPPTRRGWGQGAVWGRAREDREGQAGREGDPA